MKIRNRVKGEKIEPQMAPMIDVVFQLLIFFMLTLKIVAPEGDFNINMPLGAPSSSSSDPTLPDLKVRMTSNTDGSLKMLSFGNKQLGRDDRAFIDLNQLIAQIVSTNRAAENDAEVEIDADYNLDYRYTIKAIGACMGKYDPSKDEIVRYVEKVKFAPPRVPNT